MVQTDAVVSAALPTTKARVVLGVFILVIALAGACSSDQATVQAEPVSPAVAVTPFSGLEPPPPTAPVSDSASGAVENQTQDPSAPDGSNQDGSVQVLAVEIIETLPHDPAAFTQGLMVDEGFLLESTGLPFESDLRRVRPDTGEVVQIVAAPGDLFAEGLAKVGNELIQLTWQDEQALYWDATTFELNREVAYAGEGWGLCYDGARLVMSDGSPNLVFREPSSFDEIGSVRVTLEGADLHNLNELECVDGKVWANVWRTDLIVRIDPTTGVVEAVVNAATLEQPRTDEIDVLNGIAYDPTNDVFYVTGKLWPTMYKVRFVAAPQAQGD